jgi:hypothetical protein
MNKTILVATRNSTYKNEERVRDKNMRDLMTNLYGRVMTKMLLLIIETNLIRSYNSSPGDIPEGRVNSC